MKTSKHIRVIFFLILFAAFSPKKAFSNEQPGSPIYDTFEFLLKDFSYDVKKLSEEVPNSILLNIFLENGISGSFKKHVRKSFETMKVKGSSFHFKYCVACTVKRGDTIGKQVYFRKGFKNLKSVQSITKKKNVSSYGEVTIRKNMFSVVFPGQGSQKIGMIKDLYSKFDTIKQLFNDADDIL